MITIILKLEAKKSNGLNGKFKAGGNKKPLAKVRGFFKIVFRLPLVVKYSPLR
jgi:hypothetical protein